MEKRRNAQPKRGASAVITPNPQSKKDSPPTVSRIRSYSRNNKQQQQEATTAKTWMGLLCALLLAAPVRPVILLLACCRRRAYGTRATQKRKRQKKRLPQKQDDLRCTDSGCYRSLCCRIAGAIQLRYYYGCCTHACSRAPNDAQD